MFRACVLAGAGCTLGWLGCFTYGSMAVLCAVLGFFGGGLISLLPVVVADMFGTKKLGAVFFILLKPNNYICLYK